MERLGTGLDRALRQAGVPDATALTELTRAWPAAVGEAISRAAWPSRLSRDGTLHVATVSSTWAFELSRMAPEILARLEETAAGAAPAALRFAVGPVPEPAAPSALPSPQAGPRVQPEDAAAAKRLAVAVDDPALRSLIARAAAASLARERSDHRF